MILGGVAYDASQRIGALLLLVGFAAALWWAYISRT
jgi:hypothetical protein